MSSWFFFQGMKRLQMFKCIATGCVLFTARFTEYENTLILKNINVLQMDFWLHISQDFLIQLQNKLNCDDLLSNAWWQYKFFQASPSAILSCDDQFSALVLYFQETPGYFLHCSLFQIEKRRSSFTFVSILWSLVSRVNVIYLLAALKQ